MNIINLNLNILTVALLFLLVVGSHLNIECYKKETNSFELDKEEREDNNDEHDALFANQHNCLLPHTWLGSWSFNSADQAQTQSKPGSASHALKRNRIDRIGFLNKGNCVMSRQEKYFFYDNVNKCHRCLFVIQRHYNVLQYRETHCDEELNSFDELCDLLSPELALMTIIRENAQVEACTLSDSYQMNTQPNRVDSNGLREKTQAPPNQRSIHQHSNNPRSKCIRHSNAITKCADQTMLRLNLQQCSVDDNSPDHSVENQSTKKSSHLANKTMNDNEQDEPGKIAECIAHWTEGNLNYMIIKQQTYKCLVYKDLDRPFKNTNNQNIINPANNLIQLSLSDDEFCRDLYITSDGLNSYVLRKTAKQTSDREEHERGETRHFEHHCKFPRLLSKKWHNFEQNKVAFGHQQRTQIQIQSFQVNKKHRHHNANRKYFNTHRDSVDHFLKFDCIKALNSTGSEEEESEDEATYDEYYADNRPNEPSNRNYLYLVNNLLECSTKLHCLLVSVKSEFILEIKYGSFDGHECLFDRDHLIYEDFFFVETNFGINCPFSNRIYQLTTTNMRGESNRKHPSRHHHNNKRTLNNQVHSASQIDALFSFDEEEEEYLNNQKGSLEDELQANKKQVSSYSSNFVLNKPSESRKKTRLCEHYLKIGCNSNDYTLHRKCEYNQPKETATNMRRSSSQSEQLKHKLNKEMTPVLESETNQICLAYWPLGEQELAENGQFDTAYVVLSKSTNTDTFSISCSVWESSEHSKRLRIREDTENLKACSRIVNKSRDKQAFKLVNLNSNNKQRTADRLKSATAFMSASSSSLVDSSHRFDSTSIEFKYAGSCLREGADNISRNKANPLILSISSLHFIFYLIFLVIFF